MKLNGLSNSLAGNDKSLSNSYLSHIVELLRTEVANLTAKENALEAITTEHIETQKEVVDTKTVNTEKVNTSSINDKIILTEVVNVLTNLKVNGKDVLTESAFQGPFTYKGVVGALPDKAIPGDVYITSNDMVNVYNGASWDEFILPVGTVSLAEYNEDKAGMLTEISNVQNGLNATNEDLNATKATLNEAVIDISDINTKLETKVDEAPKDGNSYVRNNGEWVDLTSADNTVKQTAGVSTIENTVEGVKINSPKVEVTTVDFKINGSSLPEVDKFALSKTTEADTEYHYELKFGRSPFDATSSVRPMFCGFNDESRDKSIARSAPEMITVFTKNWQYVKWGTKSSPDYSDSSNTVNITAMDKDGNINLIANNFTDWMMSGVLYLQSSCFITFNQAYVPKGWDDTVYLFCTSVPYLVELKDGKFSRKIDIYNNAGGLKEQGFTPSVFATESSRNIGLVGGKGLRNKDIQRICFTCFDVTDVGGSWAIIIGGDRNSKLTDPFDPTKCIYIKLPSTAYYGYACMAATDSAWYLQENGTGRLLRITPNGQVLEISLSQPVKSCGYNYIEYTDKNNKPAVAYYVQNENTGGYHYVLFLEESDGGQVNFVERKLSGPFEPTGPQRYSQMFKFMENSYYIFFTADFGYNTAVGTDSNDAETFGNASMKNILWYWDKKTLTPHFIYQLYSGGLTFGSHDFIEMHKTKDNAIWFPYMIQDLSADKRTGIIKYIADIDYTNIDEAQNIDKGSIKVKSASVGKTHAFFTASTTTTAGLYYTHAKAKDKNNASQWYLTTSRSQLSATNDDGILCIISADFLSIALCYGDGNIRVYPVTSTTSMYNCDADKEPYVPDKVYTGSDPHSCPVLIGMKHGWMLRCCSSSDYSSEAVSSLQSQKGSYTYIGVHYINGIPTIATKPHLSKIIRCGDCYYPHRYKWDKYSYLQTYDDYERRNKVLGGIMAYINYGGPATGNDSFFKEVRKETNRLNLVYDNKVISSVEQ